MMKALLAMLLGSVLVFGAACSGGNSSNGNTDDTSDQETTESADDNSQGTEETETNKEDSQKAQAAALMSWELGLIANIHTTEDPFNALTALASGKKLDKAQVKELAGKAVESGNSFSEKMKQVEIPSELPKDLQDKLKASVSDLAASFKARAGAAKELKSVSSIDELKTQMATMDLTVPADAKKEDAKHVGLKEFKSFNKKLNEVQKAVGLTEPTDFSAEFQ